MALGGQRAGEARRLDHDVGPVVHSRLGLVAESQPVALDLTGDEDGEDEKHELYITQCISI